MRIWFAYIIVGIERVHKHTLHLSFTFVRKFYKLHVVRRDITWYFGYKYMRNIEQHLIFAENLHNIIGGWLRLSGFYFTSLCVYHASYAI